MNPNDIEKCYNTYSTYLKNTYGEKIYKLPINIEVTCPNRDGRLSTRGCLFCSDLGAGLEADWSYKSISDQLRQQKDHITDKYGAKSFIAYFQNYTNTYVDIETFKGMIDAALIEDVVGLSIATRPDCINKEQLKYLELVSKKHQVAIELEMGLQTTNNETLSKINRGHTVEDFIESVHLIKAYGFSICVHLIPNLPWDTKKDVHDAVNLMNDLGISQIKLHSLYIAKNTEFETMYNAGELRICDADEYIDRVITFIRHAHKGMVFQRLFARAPKEVSVFCNWGNSWRKLHNQLIKTMIEKDYYQGQLYHKGDNHE